MILKITSFYPYSHTGFLAFVHLHSVHSSTLKKFLYDRGVLKIAPHDVCVFALYVLCGVMCVRVSVCAGIV